jgi:hypothetical protein
MMAVASSNHFIFPWERKTSVHSPEVLILSPDGVANAPFSGSPLAHAKKDEAAARLENTDNDGRMMIAATCDLGKLFQTIGEAQKFVAVEGEGSQDGSLDALEQAVEAAVARGDACALQGLLQTADQLIATLPAKGLEPGGDGYMCVLPNLWRARRGGEDDWEWARRLRHADEAKVCS